MNRPDETSIGDEPVSKHLRARATKQWAETWGKELAEHEAWRRARDAAAPLARQHDEGCALHPQHRGECGAEVDANKEKALGN